MKTLKNTDIYKKWRMKNYQTNGNKDEKSNQNDNPFEKKCSFFKTVYICNVCFPKFTFVLNTFSKH